MHRLFLVEKGKIVVIRDGEKEVSFTTFEEFNEYWPHLDLTGKQYIGYEPDVGIYKDSTDKSITINDSPVKEYEDIIDAIDQIIENKQNVFFNKTEEEINDIKQNQLEGAVDQYINEVAQKKGYDNRVTCALRSGYVNKWQSEGIAFGQWMDSCYEYCQNVLVEVNDGLRTIPTSSELISELPDMIWPD